MYVLAHIPEQFVFVVYAEELLVVIGGLSWSGIYDSLKSNLQYSFFFKTERYNTDKDISKLRKRIYVLVLNGCGRGP